MRGAVAVPTQAPGEAHVALQILLDKPSHDQFDDESTLVDR